MADILPELTVLGIHIIVGGGSEGRVEVVAHELILEVLSEQAGVALGVVSVGVGCTGLY